MFSEAGMTETRVTGLYPDRPLPPCLDEYGWALFSVSPVDPYLVRINTQPPTDRVN